MTEHTDDELAPAAEQTPGDESAEDAQAETDTQAKTPTPTATLGVPGTFRRRTVAAGIAALLTVALLATTGWMLWQHQEATAEHRRAAEFAAAARQSVINLMAIDYATAQDSVRCVLDGSTGRFRDNFADSADDFVKALQDEKVITRATVNDAAVESVTGDSAVVLVSATSRREGKGAPEDQQQPRLWRVVLNLVREGGQIKMTGVEFV